MQEDCLLSILPNFLGLVQKDREDKCYKYENLHEDVLLVVVRILMLRSSSMRASCKFRDSDHPDVEKTSAVFPMNSAMATPNYHSDP